MIDRLDNRLDMSLIKRINFIKLTITQDNLPPLEPFSKKKKKLHTKASNTLFFESIC